MVEDEAVSPKKPKEEGTLNGWQRHLSPFIVMLIAGTGLYFLINSSIEMDGLSDNVEDVNPISLEQLVPDDLLRDKSISEAGRVSLVKWRTLAAAESEVLNRRYRYANTNLVAAVWLRYLGFVTGMILSLLGAALLWGKLNVPTAELSGEGAGIKRQLKTSSPGLILCVLGAVLMMTAMLNRYEISVVDKPVYTDGRGGDYTAGSAFPSNSSLGSGGASGGGGGGGGGIGGNDGALELFDELKISLEDEGDAASASEAPSGEAN